MKKKKARLIGAIVITGAAAILLLVAAYFSYQRYYAQRVYPRVYLVEKNLSGFKFLDLLNEIERLSQQVEEDGLQFRYQDQELAVEPVVVSLEDRDNPEVVSEILRFNNQELAEEIYGLGRRGDQGQNFLTKLRLFLIGQRVYLKYQLDEEALLEILQGEFSQFEQPAADAQISFVDDEITVSREVAGEVFDYGEIISQVKSNLNTLENPVVELTLMADEPEVRQEETGPLVEEAEAIIDLAPLSLVYEDKKISVTEEDLENWLKFSSQGVTFEPEAVLAFLETAAEEIETPVKEGKFSLDVAAGRVVLTQYQDSQKGLTLNKEETYQQLLTEVINNKQKEITLSLEVTEPQFTPDNLSTEIKDLLGTGQTNLGNSPYNRRLNIAKGADILNGLLIAPGETFSLVEALGEIDAANGWYPELVIKGNETKPEYGGGLCQIGTTTFRAAMMSGLPIVERQNHSYAVSYYNYQGKPGVDATIYDPKPDMRFTNDTGHYILWRSRLEGNDIYFEFWGTSDGRKGYFTEPINYNYVAPPAAVEKESPDLAPGERRCTENAHTGLTAEFDYIIERSDGTVDQQTFKSVYKAWPAVCLVGKPAEEEKPTETVTEPEPVQPEQKEEEPKKKKKKT